MAGRRDRSRSQTIVRQVSGAAGEERFCVLHEAAEPGAKAFAFTCATDTCWTHGLTMAEVCNLLIAAGISEPDVYRLLDEARAEHRPYSAAQTQLN